MKEFSYLKKAFLEGAAMAVLAEAIGRLTWFTAERLFMILGHAAAQLPIRAFLQHH